jgi:hypothetical protein
MKIIGFIGGRRITKIILRAFENVGITFDIPILISNCKN